MVNEMRVDHGKDMIFRPYRRTGVTQRAYGEGYCGRSRERTLAGPAIQLWNRLNG